MKKLLVAVAMLLAITVQAADKRDLSRAEKKTIQSAVGVWVSPSNEVWRIDLIESTGQMVMFFGDADASPRLAEIYPERGAFNLLTNNMLFTAKVTGEQMTLVSEDGYTFTASYVRPINQRDWDMFESIWHPADRGCGAFGQFC